jgi:hypothetical protein
MSQVPENTTEAYCQDPLPDDCGYDSDGTIGTSQSVDNTRQITTYNLTHSF